MEGAPVENIPFGDKWLYEPKRDGFRRLVFREGSKIQLRSKSLKPLTRYFPEVAVALERLKPKIFVLDGEFAILQQRLSLCAIPMSKQCAASIKTRGHTPLYQDKGTDPALVPIVVCLMFDFFIRSSEGTSRHQIN